LISLKAPVQDGGPVSLSAAEGADDNGGAAFVEKTAVDAFRSGKMGRICRGRLRRTSFLVAFDMPIRRVNENGPKPVREAFRWYAGLRR
jgi:hypothetical protein